MSKAAHDTIAACATAQGKSGVALIRISGSQSWQIAASLSGTEPEQAGHLRLAKIHDADNQMIDQVMIACFRQPASFTGEDTAEITCHGSPILVEMLLERIFQLGARPAQPGEFSKRAFLNNKLDLTQAEAIADLIDAGSRQAARNALRSLQGVFAEQTDRLIQSLTRLRVLIEAQIDFPEEETGDDKPEQWRVDIEQLIDQVEQVCRKAQQGCRINRGYSLILLGAPNSGKSTLFNSLLGEEQAIVTDQAGTTRDLLRQQWQLGKLQLELIDTAGLRSAQNQIEQIGIARACDAARLSDHILFVFDNSEQQQTFESLRQFQEQAITLIQSKVDLRDTQPATIEDYQLGERRVRLIRLSAKTGQGIDLLRQHLESTILSNHNEENLFSARQRHIDALNQAKSALQRAHTAINNQLEFAAQDLLEAQNHLGTITGAITADDLLGRIFSSFCIGK